MFRAVIIGCVEAKPRRVKEGRPPPPPQPPEFLYSVTRHRPTARTNNLVQWSSAILNQSKCLLFGKALVFLRFFRPDSVEIVYIDTDR